MAAAWLHWSCACILVWGIVLQHPHVHTVRYTGWHLPWYTACVKEVLRQAYSVFPAKAPQHVLLWFCVFTQPLHCATIVQAQIQLPCMHKTGRLLSATQNAKGFDYSVWRSNLLTLLRNLHLWLLSHHTKHFTSRAQYCPGYSHLSLRLCCRLNLRVAQNLVGAAENTALLHILIKWVQKHVLPNAQKTSSMKKKQSKYKQ